MEKPASCGRIDDTSDISDFIQPDLGTSLVFCAITLGMLYICGLSIKLVKQALIGLLVISPIVWFFVLHEYQK